MTNRNYAPARALPPACGSSFRASLLGRVSLAAVLAGSAAPRALAGSPHFGLQQALASASAAASRVSGNAAAISAGQQATIGIANLQNAAKRVTSMQQALAARAAGVSTDSIPNGLTAGGLVPETGYDQSGNGVWVGVSATAPLTQTSSGGTTTVTINQTAAQAMLNWTSFNVGAQTHLVFNQSAGGAAASSWTVLNRVTGSTSPSEIFGAITAPGQVLILNPNGVLFGAGAQVNLHSLVAGAISISDAQFTSTGIFGTFTLDPKIAANSAVTVEAGAVIATPMPANASDGGGSVILLANTVQNGGTIETPAGQTILSGGGTFTLRTGYSVPANTTITVGACVSESACSTTLGTEIDASGGGSATNTGYIAATTGDITLDARTVTQGGILYATTSVSRRGTIHLLSETTDADSSITFAPGSLTMIAPDPDSLTASNSQRDDTPREAYKGAGLADQAGLTDYPDRSRVEITTGGLVDFQTNSLVLANGGQVAISTEPTAGTAAPQGRVFMASGAQIDVSGLNNVIEPMSANIFSVNIQGITLADSSINREAGSLFSGTVTLDARKVIYVAPSTVDPNPRDYAAGGLLEVSGALSQIEQSIDEWSAIGGNVTMRSGTVVSQPGAVVNIAGGTIVYQAGSIPQTYLISPGGVLYNANTAPVGLLYSGFYDGDVIEHKRWHTTDSYANPLLTPAIIQSPAYIEGRDAGTLTLATPTALFEGSINAGVQTGPYQTVAHNTVGAAGAYTDPVTINQNVAPQAGSLYFADAYFPGDTASTAFQTNVSIAADTPSIAGSLTATSKISGALINTAVFGAGQLDGLGGLFVETGTVKTSSTGSVTGNIGAIDVQAAVALAPGGTVTLAAPSVTLDAPISARSGSVTLETIDPITISPLFPGDRRGTITVSASGTIDTRGLWTNLLTNPADTAGAAFVNGGNVTLLSTGALNLAAGSLIDASSGAIATGTSSTAGGKGGNIALVADDPALLDVKSATNSGGDPLAPAIIDGTVRSLGVTAGGTFSLTAPSIAIGDGLIPASQLQTVLSPGFFLSGFSAYALNGFYTPTGALGGAGSADGVVVAPGTAVTVAEPVWQATPTALLSPSGTDPSVPLAAVLNPEFILNPGTNSFARRAGASLTLSSVLSPNGGQTDVPGSGITIGAGAYIRVDTGQSVTLTSPSQITVNGAIHAPSGTISVLNTGTDIQVDPVAAAKLSIWIGGTSVLDVAGEAVTGTNAFGKPVGEVFAGGSIVIGAAGPLTSLTEFADNSAYGAAYVFVRPGAVLDASGASANLDLSAGTYGSVSAPAGQTAQAALTHVASAGGTIAISSDFGIYLDNDAQGGIQAASGGAGAAGGALVIRLGDPGYSSPGTSSAWANWAFTPHQIVVSQDTSPTLLPSTLTPGDGSFATTGANGQAAISQQQISDGGFGLIFLLALDQITFSGSVSLKAAQSITLADFATSETSKTATVALSAPYVLLAGADAANYANGLTGPASPDLLYDNTIFGSNGGKSYSQASPCVSGLANCYNASLTVSASLIDLEGQVTESGAYAAFYRGLSGASSPVLNSYGFNAVDLVSTGDIRFVPNNYSGTNINNANGVTLEDDGLVSEGNIAMQAARIYPATGVDATIVAGFNYWGNKDALQQKYVDNTLYYGSSLTITGSAAGVPQAPLSVFGRLGFEAATVTQDGNLFAPLGQIGLGNLSGEFARPNAKNPSIATTILSVTLGAGSTTSVSASGLTVPFGGTTDGTSYEFAGQALNLPAASLGINLPAIELGAPVTNVAAGATLDLAGGGTLTGGTGELVSGGALTSQGFISGRGGSTDTLVTPFISFNAKTLTATQPTLAQDPIFAIVPSFQSAYAPVSELETPSAAGLGYYGSLPQVGEQITLAKSVDGLAAGTYTLLPSYYALLPGAYRVQIVASSVAGLAPALTGAALPLGNGTVETTGNLSTADTGVYNVTPNAIYLTPAASVRTYSQYDEETYSTYGSQSAAVFGNPRPILPQDAGAILDTISQLEELKKIKGTLTQIAVPATGSGLNFDGKALLSAGSGGYSGELVIVSANQGSLTVLQSGGTLAANNVGVSASAIDAVGAPIVEIGGAPASNDSASQVTVQSGVTLSAGALFLVGSQGVTVDAGATLTTIGQTVTAPDSSNGTQFSTGSNSVLGLANGNFQFATVDSGAGSAPITIGACASNSSCGGLTTTLLSDGFLGFLAQGPLNIGANVVFGARDLQLAARTLTIGTPSSSGTASSGAMLTQAILDQLIAGDAAAGIPALQTLSLAASTAIDFLAGATLNTIDPATGKSTLGELVITTPAFYGQNSAADAFITTGTLVWNGVAGTSSKPAPIPTGFGDGTGTLTIQADKIVIGYPAAAQTQNTLTLGHTISGFSTVMLDAGSELTANNHASLSVYQCVAAACASSSGSATASAGGTLDILSPVVTTDAGAILGIAAGGDINLTTTGNAAKAVSSLGGEIDLTASNIGIDTRLALQSGKFTALATDALTLGANAVLDLSGPTVTIIDQTRGSFGGAAELTSQTGNVSEAAGALIDISSTGANAGSLTARAPQGTVSLAGTLQAGAPGAQESGSVAITASSFGGDSAFQALTDKLTAGGATYAQTFEQTGTGALTIGSITAANVSVSVDGGNLTVTGTIDASSLYPGSIGLASTGNLTLAADAVLNVQESALHTDQLGKLIVAENRPHIELQVASNTASPGTLTLAAGSTIDMAGPGGLALGDLEIDAPRSADNTGLQIAASGGIAISGAATIAVNAFKTYVAGVSEIGGRIFAKDGTITQSSLNRIDTESLAFMADAVSNGTLTSAFASALAGLTSYADAFHLRPGVEIDSGADGNLTTTGALNLAAFRYASVNPDVAQPSASAYGAGETGVLWLRTANDLNIGGNISDGFETPPTVTIAYTGKTYNTLWALSSMLQAGDLSWSLRLVAGADLAAADSRVIMGPDITGSAAASGGGNLILSDKHTLVNEPGNEYSEVADVLRTGTGYLDLYAGGNFTEQSLYGIYTSGTQDAAAPHTAGQNFTTDGGDVTLVIDGGAQGYVIASFKNQDLAGYSNDLTNWLQHGRTGWWYDFGRLGTGKLGGALMFAVGGLGTFGGGNLDVSVGGNAGSIKAINPNSLEPVGQGLDLTVGTSGYTVDGTTTVLGGGDIRLTVGGVLNPVGGYVNGPASKDDLYGNITDLRGNISINAGSVGYIGLLYTTASQDPRPANPFVSETFDAFDGPALVIGDGKASLSTRGDLVLGGVGNGGGIGFSFYQPASAVLLFSAGGNVVPTTIFDNQTSEAVTTGASPSGPSFEYYPATLDVIAASQNIYLEGGSGVYNLELAPSALGSLNILAAQSIYDTPKNATTTAQLAVEMSGAATVAASELPGLLFPVQVAYGKSFVAETASGLLHAGDPQPARFYAGDDIVGLDTGVIVSNQQVGKINYTGYIGATSVQIIAGNDVVETGGASYTNGGTVAAVGNGPDFFLNNSPNDISLIKAGNDILFANADVAGPGQLMLMAGGNIYQGSNAGLQETGVLLSLGEIGNALTPLTRESGAGITVLAGLNGGYNPTGFANLYLNPANLATGNAPLQDQKGKVERTYPKQLMTWLQARGYTGTEANALTTFLALPEYEQTSFLLTVYYAELNQSGLDYNNPDSRFYRSYTEGKEAVSTLFPNTDPTGQSAPSGGSLTLFSAASNGNDYDSAIRTEFGGAIQTIVPYGQTLLGNYGIVPQATAGILTQGSGDIDMYSYGSVTLGQSRVLTTYGGNVLIWMSSNGEINAGRGSKTTALTPPPNISYDPYGNIFLSPTVPSSGAGIGALAPIAGIPAGDVNLIAPAGTIDAGEAGVRASGNINVAALTVVNSANLSSGGKTSGVPAAAGPSVAATAAASAAAGSSQSATQNTLQQRAPQQQPSIIEVEVLAGGVAAESDEERRKKRPRA